HVRQAKIPPPMPERQPLVIEPQQVQNRRVEVVDVHLILDDRPAAVVRLAIRPPTLHARPRQPRRICMGMMTALARPIVRLHPPAPSDPEPPASPAACRMQSRTISPQPPAPGSPPRGRPCACD